MMSQAQLLQCPDCGYRHDLAVLGDVHTFRCEQCGRALKVPAQFRNGASGDTEVAPDRTEIAPDRTEVAPDRTEVAPEPELMDVAPPAIDVTERQPAAMDAKPAFTPIPPDEPAAQERVTRPPRRRSDGRVKVPLVWRLLIWLFAIPIGLVVVFQLIARKLGWLTQNQLLDAFTAGGWDRFRPIAQLLPLAALVIALIVQVSVYGLERLYRRRDGQRSGQRAVRPTGS